MVETERKGRRGRERPRTGRRRRDGRHDDSFDPRHRLRLHHLKAILIELVDVVPAQTRGEAPTTVEAPFEDVTRGVLNAVKEIEELRSPDPHGSASAAAGGNAGVGLYVSTSSAGGGLQMMVSGLVLQMTGERQRAALGASAIVMDDRAQRRAAAAREDQHLARPAP